MSLEQRLEQNTQAIERLTAQLAAMQSSGLQVPAPSLFDQGEEVAAQGGVTGEGKTHAHIDRQQPPETATTEKKTRRSKKEEKAPAPEPEAVDLAADDAEPEEPTTVVSESSEPVPALEDVQALTSKKAGIQPDGRQKVIALLAKYDNAKRASEVPEEKRAAYYRELKDL